MQALKIDRRLNTNSTKVARDSSFELLRIMSMFFIVICHFATHGGFDFGAQTLTLPRFWWYFIEMGGNFGVDVFVLISGYFLVASKNELFNANRILKFWGQVFFYSIAIYVIFGIAGINEFSLKSLVKTVFPITFGQWWFASTYFVLYLIHPFLNNLLNKIDKKTYQSLLTLLITIWCIIPTFTGTSFQSNSLLWFITLYCVAGYIRLFDLNRIFTTKHFFCFWLLFSALRYLSSVILIILGTKIPFAADHSLHFYGTQSVLTFLSALSLFMAFKSIKMDYQKWINSIASASFGVYLIHDSGIIRPFLWTTVFKNATYQNTAFLIPYSIFAVLLVYTVSTIIDLLRQATIEKVFLSILNSNVEKLLTPFNAAVSFFKKLLFGNQEQIRIPPPATSRTDNKTGICPECETREALDAAGIDAAEQEKILAEIQKAAQKE